MIRPNRYEWLAVPVICGLFLAADATAQSEDLASLPGPVKVTLFEAQELRNEGRFDESVALIEGYLENHPEHEDMGRVRAGDRESFGGGADELAGEPLSFEVFFHQERRGRIFLDH